MTTRRMMIVVAAAASILAAYVVIDRFDQRANHCRLQAEYHQRIEREFVGNATVWEAYAKDPLAANELPYALVRSGYWSKEQAREIELETQFAPSRPKWKQCSSAAIAIAIEQTEAWRKRSDYHAQRRRRYEDVAFSPWLSLGPEPAWPSGPEPAKP